MIAKYYSNREKQTAMERCETVLALTRHITAGDKRPSLGWLTSPRYDVVCGYSQPTEATNHGASPRADTGTITRYVAISSDQAPVEARIQSTFAAVSASSQLHNSQWQIFIPDLLCSYIRKVLHAHTCKFIPSLHKCLHIYIFLLTVMSAKPPGGKEKHFFFHFRDCVLWHYWLKRLIVLQRW